MEKFIPAEAIEKTEATEDYNEELVALINGVRESVPYIEALKKRTEMVRKVNPEASDEEIRSTFESTADSFKQSFWEYVERFRKESGTLPTVYRSKDFRKDVRLSFNEYVDLRRDLKKDLNRGEISKGDAQFRNNEVVNAHNKVAEELVKEGDVPNILWGRMVTRIWCVQLGLFDLGTATLLDEERRSSIKSNIE